MKKVLLFLVIFFSSRVVYAKGNVIISKNSISLAKGQSTSFTVNGINVAGVIKITSSNPNVVTVD